MGYKLFPPGEPAVIAGDSLSEAVEFANRKAGTRIHNAAYVIGTSPTTVAAIQARERENLPLLSNIGR